MHGDAGPGPQTSGPGGGEAERGPGAPGGTPRLPCPAAARPGPLHLPGGGRVPLPHRRGSHRAPDGEGPASPPRRTWARPPRVERAPRCPPSAHASGENTRRTAGAPQRRRRLRLPAPGGGSAPPDRGSPRNAGRRSAAYRRPQRAAQREFVRRGPEPRQERGGGAGQCGAAHGSSEPSGGGLNPHAWAPRILGAGSAPAPPAPPLPPAAHLPAGPRTSPPRSPRGRAESRVGRGPGRSRVPPPPPRARPPSPPRSPAALRQSPGPAVDGQPGPGGAASLTSRSGICMGCGAAAAAQCLSVRRRELPEPEPRSAAAGSADARLGPSRAQHGAAGGGRARLRRGEHREEADPKGAEGRRRGGGEGAAGGRRVPLNAVSLPPALRRAEWSTW